MKKRLAIPFQIALLLLIAVGIYFRFYRLDWNQGAHLHPDEYGLTNTLTQLRIPKTIGEYFNTRISPMSPYRKYDLTGQPIADGPDNGMRWGQLPMTIIRFVAEQAHTTGYDELRLTGRELSALADTLSLLLLFLIGSRLFNRKVGLLATALSALAVLQIQQSHFMTVDNFAVLFTMLALYACVRIAQEPGLTRMATNASSSISLTQPYLPNRKALVWYLVFGVSFGMALASKINLLPLGGMVLIAGFISIADLKLKSQQDLPRIFLVSAVLISIAGLAAILTFRLVQPIRFRQPVGDTGLLTWQLNPDWVDNMNRAQSESNGYGGGPPGEQWVDRLAIVFPWVNIVLWGLGLPLGLLSWLAFLWVVWRLVRYREDWRAQLLPVVWTGGYFAFMATRWVKSIRYFLPIYPFLAIFAAWGLVRLWQKYTSVDANTNQHRQRLSFHPYVRAFIPAVISLAVVLGTLIWAGAFMKAVYQSDHTRIQAVRWMFANIPSPFHLTLTDAQGAIHFQPVSAPDTLSLAASQVFVRSFTSSFDGDLASVTIPHLAAQGGPADLAITIAADPDGQISIDRATIDIDPHGGPQSGISGAFHQGGLKKGETYYLIASNTGGGMAAIRRTVIANETWDEGLPFPLDGIDPFGQLYNGIPMEVRWYDDENKRQMFINTLSQADYIILPSQRSIWTTCRIPRTYRMTMEYYRALFAGQLGFDLVASFSAPIGLGPVWVSDVGGTLAWNQTPPLPLFNHSLLAAEEAFSVYDHPPVWVFKKQSDYNQNQVEAFFRSIDLSQIVIQSARQADTPPCQ